MATLALGALGALAGGALAPGLSLAGGAITGAVLGRAVGSLAGSVIDGMLFGASGQSRAVEGPRLKDLHVTSSSEGSPIPRVYGGVRLGGEVIWATNFEEEVVTSGGGGGSGKGAPQPASGGTTEYRYHANFAIALCEGAIASIGRVWADGEEFSLDGVTFRLYHGTEDQAADPLILAKQNGRAPAYRGLAYIVFERFPLADFGNRLPQLSFEVQRPVDDFAKSVRAVTIIPAAGEFIYAPYEVTRTIQPGQTVSETINTGAGKPDFSVSMDRLQDAFPNLAHVSLIVSWFGTDLRAGTCLIRPAVEARNRNTSEVWQVAGYTRSTAHLVSQVDGRPAFGGTPTDASVKAAIAELVARGLKVTFYPFILMDVPPGNALPDPYSAAASQPAFPWRGRITCDPASGQPGTVDKTAAAGSQVASFVAEYRAMILHYAQLCKDAGGVDAFLIGSELRGLTTIRDGVASFPFVMALKTLAADVRAIVGAATKISYAADWSEYFGHQPPDGSGDALFHLDPLWSDANIAAVGIDCYFPLADWRDGPHLDAALAATTYDLGYLKGNFRKGEGYDWYYASNADRNVQIRSNITDGAYNKPWVYRPKDLWSWWANPHFNRIGGVEQAEPTAWAPQSKPFWLTEYGCPAVDKGANQPNVFYDPKSSESFRPYFSSGQRDDFMQRRYIEAGLTLFDPDHVDFEAADNPVSTVYAGRMLDFERIYLYTWDARPYPAFPARADIWGDAANWSTGHWLSGRVASAPLDKAVAQILTDYGFAQFDASGLTGALGGLVIDRLMSARAALQALELAFFFDAIEGAGEIVFRHRGAEPVRVRLAPADLVVPRADAAGFTLTRTQEAELPRAAKLSFLSQDHEYRQAVVEDRRAVAASDQIATASLPLVLTPAQAQTIVRVWLNEAWAARERLDCALSPEHLALEPGDMIELIVDGGPRPFRLTEIADGEARRIQALATAPELYRPTREAARPPATPSHVEPGVPVLEFLDVPRLRASDPEAGAYLAAFANPWSGGVAVYRSPEDTGFALDSRLSRPAVFGETKTAVSPGPLWRWDEAHTLEVEIRSGALLSATDLQVFAGSNALAIEHGGGWEVIQFRSASLIGERRYRLSGLLRGQLGTEALAKLTVAEGAATVLLDGAVVAASLPASDIGLALNWRYGPATRDIGHGSYQTTTHAFTGRGLAPLSPVHGRARRSGSGVAITWIRRTRDPAGDSWEGTEVPLGEASEVYDLAILSGATVVRTITALAPSHLYPAAEELADFGTPQTQLAIRIRQLSPSYGPGAALEATIHVN